MWASSVNQCLNCVLSHVFTKSFLGHCFCSRNALSWGVLEIRMHVMRSYNSPVTWSHEGYMIQWWMVRKSCVAWVHTKFLLTWLFISQHWHGYSYHNMRENSATRQHSKSAPHSQRPLDWSLISSAGNFNYIQNTWKVSIFLAFIYCSWLSESVGSVLYEWRITIAFW
jgi:hypothetical protein